MHPALKEIKPYLDAAELMVVASSQNNRPYTATVFFCYDEKLNIHFLSTIKRRHSQEIVNNSHISVAMANQRVLWGDVMKGLQIEGICSVLDGEEARKAFKLYVERFPKAQALEEEFSGKDDEGNHKVWKIIPSAIKVWDENRYGYEGKVFHV